MGNLKISQRGFAAADIETAAIEILPISFPLCIMVFIDIYHSQDI